MKSKVSNIQIASYSDLFGSNENEIINVDIDSLVSFRNHPFHVDEHDPGLLELIESMKISGQLVPGIVRKKSENNYEIISGHKRALALKAIGNSTMQVIVKDITDDEAILQMVDSNIYREVIKPSEKAHAFKMKLQSLKRQGIQTPAFEIGKEVGKSARQVQRYIRLSYLIPELLEFVDNHLIKFIPAVELSYLDRPEQLILLNVIKATKKYPSLAKAKKLRELFENGEFSESEVMQIFDDAPISRKITLQSTTISEYFSEEYTPEEIENVIVLLLEKWSKSNGKGKI